MLTYGSLWSTVYDFREGSTYLQRCLSRSRSSALYLLLRVLSVTEAQLLAKGVSQLCLLRLRGRYHTELLSLIFGGNQDTSAIQHL
jgi:hypothetical protein